MDPEAHRRTASVALAVVASFVGAFAVAPLSSAAPAVDAAAGTGTTVVPAPAVVGQQADVGTRIAQSTAAGSIQLVVSLSTAVTAVNADGSYTTRSTISTLDVRAGSDLAADAPDLVNQSFEQSFGASGAALPESSNLINGGTMSAAQQRSGRTLVDSLAMVRVGFPAEPVAVGASWSADGMAGIDGIVVPVTYQCRLTAATTETWTVELSYAQSFSQPSDAGRIEATVAGTGTVVGSRTNPLAGTATLYQTVDGIQGSTLLRSDLSVSVTGTGR